MVTTPLDDVFLYEHAAPPGKDWAAHSSCALPPRFAIEYTIGCGMANGAEFIGTIGTTGMTCCGVFAARTGDGTLVMYIDCDEGIGNGGGVTAFGGFADALLRILPHVFTNVSKYTRQHLFMQEDVRQAARQSRLSYNAISAHVLPLVPVATATPAPNSNTANTLRASRPDNDIILRR